MMEKDRGKKRGNTKKESRLLGALRDDLLSHPKIKRQLECDHARIEDVNITLVTGHCRPAMEQKEKADVKAVCLYRAASDKYQVLIDREFKPIRFSIGI